MWGGRLRRPARRRLGRPGTRSDLAERLHDFGAPAATRPSSEPLGSKREQSTRRTASASLSHSLARSRAAPIILYVYPRVAPESAGDLYDGTAIDEILTLRIMTLTDEEKREMRAVDEPARRKLERTETLLPEQLMKLHGAVPGPRPSEEGDG